MAAMATVLAVVVALAVLSAALALGLALAVMRSKNTWRTITMAAAAAAVISLARPAGAVAQHPERENRWRRSGPAWPTQSWCRCLAGRIHPPRAGAFSERPWRLFLAAAALVIVVAVAVMVAVVVVMDLF